MFNQILLTAKGVEKQHHNKGNRFIIINCFEMPRLEQALHSLNFQPLA